MLHMSKKLSMMLKQASKFLDSQRQKFLTENILYKKQNSDELEIKATIGKTLFRAENDYGITTRIEVRDFLILANDLQSEPAKGDTIIYNNVRYEVLAPNGESVWRWSGTSNTTYRIHTKEIGVIDER